MQTTDLNVTAACGVAMLRKVQRLSAIRSELAEVGWDGLITASDLFLLETMGFMLNFDDGSIIDTWTAVDAETVQACAD